MKCHSISDSVFALHADIETDDLFEGIWPIPHGVSLNSYAVKGGKTALIDLVRDWMDAPRTLEAELAQAGMSLETVDYLVLNHMEPDHTGWLAEFRAINPKAEIVTTGKAAALAKSFYKLDTGIRVVKTGDTLDLGKGMVLRFVETPNVHWPETMMTFEPVSGTIFACDAFGSYGKLGDRIFDDQFTAAEHVFFEKESLRYYANIVASFNVFVQRAAQKLEDLDIKVVAPSHGIVWRQNPKTIIDRYVKYASYGTEPEKEICVIWGSMYGNTERGLKAVIKGIESEGVPYSIHRIPNEDLSFVLADAYKSKGILLAMPTYEYAMFPPMAWALDIFGRKHVNNREALRIGSWGWVGGAKKEYDEKIVPLKWNCMEAVEWAGRADDETMSLLEERGKELARKVKVV